jgi:DNA polymerase III delta subunit
MAGSFSPATLLVGDLYLLEERSKALRLDFEQKIKGEIFTQLFSLTETPLDSILASARNLPFLASFQIFRIQNTQALKEKKLESLSEYLQNPSKTTALIFEAPSLDKDHALVKLLNKSGTVIYIEAADKKMAGVKLVREKIRRAGKTLAPGV